MEDDKYDSGEESDHQNTLSTKVLNWIDLEFDWISPSEIALNDPLIGTKMNDIIMRKYRKRESQPAQEFRKEMNTWQQDESWV